MSSVFSAAKIIEATKLISAANHIVITSHKNPDGDAVGSALAIYHLLKAAGKSCCVVLPDEAPDFLRWMPCYAEVLHFNTGASAAQKQIANADLIFALDYNHLGRVGKEMEAELRKTSVPFIMIDHHHQPESLSGVIFSDTDSCSTCQMVYQFATACLWPVQGAAAECVYCGIITDSGSFRFPSVTAETHTIVAALIAGGLDHAQIHRLVYDTNLLDRLQLIGYALSNKLEVMPDCAAATVWLDAEELKRFNHRPGDTEGLVNQALSILGVKVAAFIREGNNEVKISLRSKGTFDVNTYARVNWRGGGHTNAAGGSTDETITDAVARIKNELHEMKDAIKAS
ncbi:MAG: DHH family phosphoesterase [Flavobacteriales bacterium]